MAHRNDVVIFDVNETLLDLSALDLHFERSFGNPAAREEWFAQLLQSAFVTTIVGYYEPFGAVAGKALEAIAERHGRTLAESERNAILSAMRQLPAHSDAAPALARLRDAGLRLAALTNSTAEVAKAQLDHARLSGFFERMLSVDAVRRFKPAVEVYRYAAAELGVGPAQMWMVAAHGWDVAGAMGAGCRAAFVSRPGRYLEPAFEPPEIVEPDLDRVAIRIIDRQDSKIRAFDSG